MVFHGILSEMAPFLVDNFDVAHHGQVADSASAQRLRQTKDRKGASTAPNVA